MPADAALAKAKVLLNFEKHCMLGQFLFFLKKDLNDFISQKMGIAGNFVIVTNLNNIFENANGTDNKIIISIVNIEEEKMLKRPENYVKINNEINYKNPPVWVNLICLFTFFTKSNDDYEGIDLLGNIIQYFQSRPRLDKSTVIDPGNFPGTFEEVRAEFVSLNYEQTNYLWGLFGGRYHPSVIYKFKTLPIDNHDLTPGGPPIADTMVIANHKHQF